MSIALIRSFRTLLLLSFLGVSAAAIAQGNDPAAAEEANESAFVKALKELNWVKGPTTVSTVGESELVIPEGYVFLNKADTAKFLELNQNLSDGDEMMVAPDSLAWSAYLSFADEGYVKDDEKIDDDALLNALKEGTEAGNSERRKRGWEDLHVVGWAIPPAYNNSTKRLEWATTLQSGGGQGVNFFTKILGRSGHTTVVLVSSPAELTAAESQLNTVLTGYRFTSGHAYADYRPGDKVAAYGLAALVLGGAAAVATKKGFWAVIAGFFAAAWKILIPAVVAIGAGLRKLFSKRSA
jgi:uncharacterized membrane-anchored protein